MAHPACNIVGDAMKKTGMSYQTISQKTGSLSEKEVEDLCTGKKLASPEQHDAISKALGLTDDTTSKTDSTKSSKQKQTLCQGRTLQGDLKMLMAPGTTITKYHDANEALGLVRHHRAIAMHTVQHIQHARALQAHTASRIGSLPGARIIDVPKLPLLSKDLKHFKFTEASLRSGFAAEDLQSMHSHKGLNPPGCFTWLKLCCVVKYTEDTSRFDFAFDDPLVVSDVLVSSTCVVTAPEEKPLYEDEGTPPICPPEEGDTGPTHVYRAYTPITTRGAVGILSFTIKKQDKGKMSNYIHEMEIGQRLGIMGYLQRPPSMTPWTLNQFDAVTLLAGGVGLTPILQIIQYSLHDPSNTSKFLLLFANSTESDIAMREELDGFQRRYPANFEVVYVLSRPPPGWTGETGRIDATLINKYAPPPADYGVRSLVCVSGPPAMLDALAGPREGDRYNGYTGQGELQGALLEVGYTAEQVHKF
ncbi:hypothetical protein B0H34DRAFT_729498 [Crassisporium funariophilum]|nr:hypothetical protein B0H34DRAFT_729498 [Crassisporium funariophilum]